MQKNTVPRYNLWNDLKLYSKLSCLTKNTMHFNIYVIYSSTELGSRPSAYFTLIDLTSCVLMQFLRINIHCFTLSLWLWTPDFSSTILHAAENIQEERICILHSQHAMLKFKRYKSTSWIIICFLSCICSLFVIKHFLIFAWFCGECM